MGQGLCFFVSLVLDFYNSWPFRGRSAFGGRPGDELSSIGEDAWLSCVKVLFCESYCFLFSDQADFWHDCSCF